MSQGESTHKRSHPRPPRGEPVTIGKPGDPSADAFRKRLFDVFYSTGLTRTEFGERLGRHQSFVTRVLNGDQSSITKADLEAWARTAKHPVSPLWLQLGQNNARASPATTPVGDNTIQPRESLLGSETPASNEVSSGQGEGESLVPLHHRLNNSPSRKAEIENFCEELASSPDHETSFAPFYKGVPRATWMSGAGIVQTTASEFFEVWAEPEYFEPYEASMYLLKQNGLDVRRLFVLTHAAMRAYKDEWHKVITRHEELGLAPKFILSEDAEMINREIGVSCDALGVVNEERMVLVKLRQKTSSGGLHLPGDPPIMLQTTNRRLCEKASNILLHYWDNASDPDSFRSWSGPLPANLRASLNEELKNILFRASCLIDPPMNKGSLGNRPEWP
jgi:transcriptional regulator with XRE-family HTH domain